MQWWDLTKKAIAAWIDDYAPSMGAALSYYSVFSMAPLLLLVISIAGLIFGEEAARGQLLSTFESLMGSDGAKAIQDMLAAMATPSRGVTGTVIGIGVLVIGATTVFGELQDALDRIWRAPGRTQSGGILGLLRSRVLSFGMVLGLAFLLMVSLVMTAVVSALGSWWGGFFGNWEVLLQIVNAAFGFALTALGFAMIYKWMPRVKVQWRDVWWGAAITALLFTLGKFLIGLYIGKTGVASGFGAAGSIVVVLVWVYYSAQIFLLGAEFTWVYAHKFGSRRDEKTLSADDHPEEIQRPEAAVETVPETIAATGVEARPVLSTSPPAHEPIGLAGWVLRIGVALAVNVALALVARRLGASPPRRETGTTALR